MAPPFDGSSASGTAPAHTRTVVAGSTADCPNVAVVSCHALIEHLPAVTYVEALDEHGTLQYINPQIETLLGFTAEEWLEDPGIWRRQLHPDDRDRVLAAVDGFRRGAGPARFQLDYRLLNRDSDAVWVRDVRVVVTDPAGTPLFVQGIGLDITELKQAEEESRHSRDEERFRSLVQNVSDIITVYDAGGTVRYISSAVERVLGYTPEESIGTQSSAVMHPDDARAMVGFLTRAGASPGGHLPVQVRLQHKDGSWRHLEAIAHNLLHDPNVAGVVVTSRDVTERVLADAERERLRAEALDRRREVEILLEISTALNAAVTEREMARAVAARLAALCEPEYPTVGLIGDARIEFTRLLPDGTWEEQQYAHPDSGSINSHVLATGRPYRSDDLASDPLSNHAVDVEMGFRTQLAVPIVGADGRVLGIINLYNKAGDRRFSDHDQAVTEAVAAELGVALERARSRAELAETLAALRQSEARFRSLVQNGSDLITVMATDGTVQYVSPSAERLLGFQPAELIGANALDWVHPDDRATAAQMFARRVTEPEAPRVRGGYRIRHKDGSWRFMDTLSTNLLDEPSVRGIVINLRDITERIALEQELARQAFSDSLTGLPNRALFLDRLHHALERVGRRAEVLAVLYLDLDGFKVINDSLGHAAGDLLLVAVGHRLAGCLRPGDTVARFGGDEFAVLLEDLDAQEQAIAVAERVVAELRRPFTVEGREVFVTASIGITFGDERHARPDELLREADIALYQAKAAGKSQTAVFNAVMNARAVERLELETDLRRAVERGELVLEYQPVIELKSGSILGAEALVRWRHPTRGRISPADFVPIAEETGLILPIGRWILAEACRRARGWQALCPPDRPFVVSVNLSARQFQQPDLAAQVAWVLGETGLPAPCLRLEITESTAMADAESTIRTLTALKSLGIRLAIDDFGTGYSSLDYLRRFPVDTLKVDRAFIGDLTHDDKSVAIVRALIRLSHALGITVTAEGIETAEQLAQLRRLRCDRGQGFYFAQPLSVASITTLLEERLPRPLGIRRPRRAAG
jgi:diguanylate cyclase (GGDEF)-like protein/PAS domain S-box-containing protein